MAKAASKGNTAASGARRLETWFSLGFMPGIDDRRRQDANEQQRAPAFAL
jgi:hypothetical protein